MKEPLEDFDYSREPNFTGISKAAAIDLANRYKNECQPLLSSRMPDPQNNLDSRSIVFPLEALKKYIWEIENSVRNIPDVGELGLRLYYGKYPDIAAIRMNPQHPLHNDLANLPDDYSFHHTAFIVPTFRDTDNIDRDFDPFGIENNEVVQLNRNSSDSDATAPMTAQMNHGNISPPPFLATDRESRNEGLSF